MNTQKGWGGISDRHMGNTKYVKDKSFPRVPRTLNPHREVWTVSLRFRALVDIELLIY